MGKGHSTSRITELVAQSGSPDLHLGSSSAWPPQSSPKSRAVVKAALCPGSAASQKPAGGRGVSISSSGGLCFESLEPLGIFKWSIFKPSVPGSTQGFCRHVVADSTSHLSWRQAAQFNPGKMETEVL